MFELREALDWVAGARVLGDGARRVDRVCTDTRAVAPGDLFVALRGERFDAHDFVAQAIAAGAVAVVVERAPADSSVPALVVRDSRAALGAIAAGWRGRFALPLIAVTGSNGKTTVKEMIAAILAAHFGEAQRLATRGNLNNDVGVPLTLLELRDAHRAAVVELGTNHPGEIADLARLAQAAVALVNNAQREHQEFLTVEGSARENGAAIAELGADGVAVYPCDDAHVAIWRELAGARRRLEFGLDPRAAVHAAANARPEGFEIVVEGARAQVALRIAGIHNVRNALAAAACTHAIGVPLAAIVNGLAAFEPVAGRLRRLTGIGGAVVIDDSYNANPDSVLAAIDVLAAMPAPRLLVLGDMGEVGDHGPAFHEEVGAYAAQRGIERLLALGPQSAHGVRAFGERAEHFDEVGALLERARECAATAASVLVKGSRFMRMERVVQALTGAVGGAH